MWKVLIFCTIAVIGLLIGAGAARLERQSKLEKQFEAIETLDRRQELNKAPSSFPKIEVDALKENFTIGVLAKYTIPGSRYAVNARKEIMIIRVNESYNQLYMIVTEYPDDHRAGPSVAITRMPNYDMMYR